MEFQNENFDLQHILKWASKVGRRQEGERASRRWNVGEKKFHTYFSFKFTSLLHKACKHTQFDVLAFHTHTHTHTLTHIHNIFYQRQIFVILSAENFKSKEI